jgi:DNA-binding protein H-NS
MGARRSQLDQAIDKITDEIKVLELARERLIKARTDRDQTFEDPQDAGTKAPRPRSVKAAGA